MSILLVEDSADQAELTFRALEPLPAPVAWARDGEAALELLQGAAAERPRLILLDIRLPKLGGIEVLRRIKTDALLRTIPVVMLTTSDREADVHASYEAGANSYVTKPVKYGDLVDKIRAVKSYWLETNLGPEA